MEEDERLFPGLLLLDLNSIESSLLFLLLLRFDKVPFTQIGGESRKMKRRGFHAPSKTRRFLLSQGPGNTKETTSEARRRLLKEDVEYYRKKGSYSSK